MSGRSSPIRARGVRLFARQQHRQTKSARARTARQCTCKDAWAEQRPPTERTGFYRTVRKYASRNEDVIEAHPDLTCFACLFDATDTSTEMFIHIGYFCSEVHCRHAVPLDT